MRKKKRKTTEAWIVDYSDQNGVRREKAFARKKDADAFELKARGDVKIGTHIADSESITVKQAGEDWLSWCEGEEHEAGTLKQNREHLKLHINPLIGEQKLSRLTAPMIETFRDDLLKTRSRALSRAVITSLKALLKNAKRRGKIAFNPAADTQIAKAKRQDEEDAVMIPTKDQMRAILQVAAELWPMERIQSTRARVQKIVAVCWYPLLVTALFTGLRCSELRGLIWAYVDLDRGVIKVRQRADFRNVLGPPKSKAGKRDVTLSPLVIDTLKLWKVDCPKTKLGLVFPTENGTIHSNGNIHKQCWGKLMRKLGITEPVFDAAGKPKLDEKGNLVVTPTLTFHALRHAACSLFIEQGMPPKEVQTVMGHHSIQFTYDKYGHLFPKEADNRRAMAEIEKRLLQEGMDAARMRRGA